MRSMDWSQYSEVALPEAFADELAMRPSRWSSVCAALHLLAASGWNLVNELGEALAGQKGLETNANGLRMMRRVFADYLTEHGLVVYETFPYLEQSVMAAVRLTDFGKTVSRGCGWEPVESGWERMIRLHAAEAQPEHTAAVLVFAREARLRGYRADILPDVSSLAIPARPDLYVIDRKRRRAYVEVETRHHREKPEKWHNLYQLQGFVAVVTKTAAQRSRLVEEIRRFRLPVWATDLETLRANARAGDPYFLFIERWDQSGRLVERSPNRKGG